MSRRLELSLLQRDVARRIGVTSQTLGNWERGRTEPMVRHYPAIMAFLGYCPYQRADNLGRKLLLNRIHQGLSHKELARSVGIDAGSLSRWETGETCPRDAGLKRLKDFFEF